MNGCHQGSATVRTDELTRRGHGAYDALLTDDAKDACPQGHTRL